MTNEQMLELAKKTINENSGFIKHNNFKVEEVTNEYCKMSVELTENSVNPNGIAHGGLLFGLAVCAVACGFYGLHSLCFFFGYRLYSTEKEQYLIFNINSRPCN